MTYLLALTTMLHAPPCHAPTPAPLPADPFQRTATMALRGDYGTLHDWQAAGYRAGLARGVTASRTIWLTGYYATEGRSGRVDCRGRRCTMRTAAANRIPQGAWVWTEHGIRMVLDRGANSNDRRAHRRGAELWTDYWYPRRRACPFGGSTVTRGAVIPR